MKLPREERNFFLPSRSRCTCPSCTVLPRRYALLAVTPPPYFRAKLLYRVILPPLHAPPPAGAAARAGFCGTAVLARVYSYIHAGMASKRPRPITSFFQSAAKKLKASEWGERERGSVVGVYVSSHRKLIGNIRCCRSPQLLAFSAGRAHTG